MSIVLVNLVRTEEGMIHQRNKHYRPTRRTSIFKRANIFSFTDFLPEIFTSQGLAVLSIKSRVLFLILFLSIISIKNI